MMNGYLKESRTCPSCNVKFERFVKFEDIEIGKVKCNKCKENEKNNN